MPGLNELQKRLSMAKEGKLPVGPIQTNRGFFELDDFTILLNRFLLLFKDSPYKSRLLEGFDLEDPNFIDSLIRILTKPATPKEKEFAEKNMPDADQLERLLEDYRKGKEVKDQIRKEIKEENQARIKELKEEYLRLEQEFEKSFSTELQKRASDHQIPLAQTQVLTKAVTSALRSRVAESVQPPELSQSLPQTINRVLLECGLSAAPAKAVGAEIGGLENHVSTAQKMAERFEVALHFSLGYHQEHLSLLLTLSLPKEVVNDPPVLRQVIQAVAKKECKTKQDVIAAVKKTVEELAPKAGEINTQFLEAALVPSSNYQPDPPVMAESHQTKKTRSLVESTIENVLVSEGIKIAPEAKKIAPPPEPTPLPTDERVFPKGKIKRAARRMIESVSHEKVFTKILSLEEKPQQEALLSILEKAFNQEGLGLPEAKKQEILERIVVRALPELRVFLIHQQESIVRLKEGLEKIDRSPVEGLANVAGAFSKKAKQAFLVGFFGADREVTQLKDHCLGRLRAIQEKSDFQKDFLGETEALARLSDQAAVLKGTVKILEGVKAQTRDSSFPSRLFVTLGKGLGKTTFRFDQEPACPLLTLADINNIDLGKFSPPRSTDLAINLNRIIGASFYQFFPRLFVKAPLGGLAFKLSPAGVKIGLLGFFRRSRNFLASRFLSIPLVQGFLGSTFFKGALAGLGKATTILRLGGKIALNKLALGIPIALELGGRLFGGLVNSFTGNPMATLGGYFGLKKEGSPGPNITKGVVIVMAAFVFILFLPVFLLMHSGMPHVAPPYALREKGRSLGITTESQATPSATPVLTPGP